MASASGRPNPSESDGERHSTAQGNERVDLIPIEILTMNLHHLLPPQGCGPVLPVIFRVSEQQRTASHRRKGDWCVYEGERIFAPGNLKIKHKKIKLSFFKP